MRRKNLGLLGMATDDSTASPPIAQDPGHSRSPPQLPIPVHNQSGLEGVSLSRLMPHSSLESQWAPQNGPQQTTPHLARAVPSRPHTGAPSGCAVPQPADLHLKARPEAAEPLTQILEASGSALRCYSCKAQASNHDCQHVQNCTSSETYCWTERIRVVDIVTRISKGCMSHCVDDAQNYYVGKKNITCCSTDLCNASGAHALRPAAVTLALLTTLGGLLLWGPSRL
ncbi:prostate stem cell antigen isoform X1 [Mustela putorius furo]|uniref:Prostate stem cell antigen isoform X1 n=1 Tax=Mustela putorius furo TaxID=9669 RepID=A0A8U0S176_MUSPF|nr:prostate stem cell antigen isoform X1 [Mustela putorius furo]XP_044934142.1 prostate stem cell antigen isoform X1 [Mustela putorius furo]XP_044934143.1 prostate stem cell antigen isoform X1 [Mustela putorius furo]